MTEFFKTAGQLGPYALFTLLMLYMILQWLKERKEIKNGGSATGICRATNFNAPKLIEQVDEIHKALMREDDDGVKLIYARHRGLEQAIVRLSENTEAQTKLLTKIYEDGRDTKRDVARVESALLKNGCLTQMARGTS